MATITLTVGPAQTYADLQACIDGYRATYNAAADGDDYEILCSDMDDTGATQVIFDWNTTAGKPVLIQHANGPTHGGNGSIAAGYILRRTQGDAPSLNCLSGNLTIKGISIDARGGANAINLSGENIHVENCILAGHATQGFNSVLMGDFSDLSLTNCIVIGDVFVENNGTGLGSKIDACIIDARPIGTRIGLRANKLTAPLAVVRNTAVISGASANAFDLATKFDQVNSTNNAADDGTSVNAGGNDQPFFSPAACFPDSGTLDYSLAAGCQLVNAGAYLFADIQDDMIGARQG